MVEDIKMLKAKVMQFMDQEVNKYGNGRMDVKQVGDLADVIKDLAEAEYYCTVADAMTQGQQDSMGYMQSPSRMGYQGGGMGSSRSGYGMGHSDPMSAIKDILMTSDPETRSMIRSEINKMM